MLGGFLRLGLLGLRLGRGCFVSYGSGGLCRLGNRGNFRHLRLGGSGGCFLHLLGLRLHGLIHAFHVVHTVDNLLK